MFSQLLIVPTSYCGTVLLGNTMDLCAASGGCKFKLPLPPFTQTTSQNASVFGRVRVCVRRERRREREKEIRRVEDIAAGFAEFRAPVCKMRILGEMEYSGG